MHTKRIIPCLDVNNGRVVKGVNFVSLRDAGDPVEIAKAYDKAGADELVFLDITASSDGRNTTVDLVRRVAERVFIPFTVGGGIRSTDDLLIYSDFIIIPFEYSDVSAKSTLVFVNFLGMLESQAERVFIRSKYDKGYKYLNQEGMDAEITKYGTLIKSPVFKRNCLQTINTRQLNYEQKYAVRNSFNELITYINENLDTNI